MLQIEYTNQFKKDLKLIKKSNKKLDIRKEMVNIMGVELFFCFRAEMDLFACC